MRRPHVHDVSLYQLIFVDVGLLHALYGIMMQTAHTIPPQSTNKANNYIRFLCISVIQAEDRKKAIRALVLDHFGNPYGGGVASMCESNSRYLGWRDIFSRINNL
jgi:hypothetical protein